MDLYIDVAKLGLGRCVSVAARMQWDKDRQAFSDRPSVDRKTGEPEFEGEFVVMGGKLRISWFAPTLQVEAGDFVTFDDLLEIEGKGGKRYYKAKGFEVSP